MSNPLSSWIRAALAPWKAGPVVRRYIRHQKRRRVSSRHKDGVILASLCSVPTVIHTYAELLPRFAEQLNARIVAFDFHATQSPYPLAVALYESFGAKIGLRASRDSALQRKVGMRAGEIFSNLQSKSDVARIRENGILLGDLIYDTYLRDLLLATVDIRDPRLLGYIRDALAFLYTAEKYFRQNVVKSVFVDHLVYIWQGVLLRMAMAQNVPVYTVYFDPRPGAQRVDLVARQEGLEAPARFNYWLYPAVFSRMTDGQKAAARERGKNHIEHRVSGGLQNSILPGQSAYAKPGGTRVLATTPAPKILVLLHDFCDAVHVYRNLLFDDFYEWIHFLLREASETPFEWYVKPHPNMNDYRRRGIENSNQRVIEELMARYPKIHFLEPSVSNRQLVDEGLSGVFTMYGTAAHEFPFLGVPAVCGADNPHVAYPFAQTPALVEEYARLIGTAGMSGPVVGADRIPEFCYMNFLYAGEHLGAETSIFEPMPSDSRGPEGVLESALQAASPASDRILDTYVQDLLAGRIPACLR